MNENNLTAPARFQDIPNETGYPVVALADYARLRGLATNHELADELDRAIVVQTELVPKDVVTMHSRGTYMDESIRSDGKLIWSIRTSPILARGKFLY